MPLLNEIESFLEDYIGEKITDSKVDIELDLGVVDDDFHELIFIFSRKFNVDISNYIWYFHSGEEGLNFGKLLFKAPYDRVERIPITPAMLTKFANNKKWNINYSVHELPKRRFDLMINFMVSILISVLILGFLLFKYFR